MPKIPEVDAYIRNSEPFAQPILEHLRELVHAVIPDVEEAIKWGQPSFLLRGGIVCGMGAFKKHCAFGFWKAQEMKDPKKVFVTGEARAMGQFGRITRLEDLPAEKTLRAYLKEAVGLAADTAGVARKRSAAVKAPREEVAPPAFFKKALQGNRVAKAKFEALRPSHQREYIQWLAEAKTDATREKRLQTAIEWISEGKSRNWKYEKRRE